MSPEEAPIRPPFQIVIHGKKFFPPWDSPPSGRVPPGVKAEFVSLHHPDNDLREEIVLGLALMITKDIGLSSVVVCPYPDGTNLFQEVLELVTARVGRPITLLSLSDEDPSKINLVSYKPITRFGKEAILSLSESAAKILEQDIKQSGQIVFLLHTITADRTVQTMRKVIAHFNVPSIAIAIAHEKVFLNRKEKPENPRLPKNSHVLVRKTEAHMTIPENLEP